MAGCLLEKLLFDMFKQKVIFILYIQTPNIRTSKVFKNDNPCTLYLNKPIWLTAHDGMSEI